MLLLIASSAIAADTFVLIGSENRINENGVLPRAKAIVDVPVVEKLPVATTFVVMPNYAEVYIGPTWKPTANFSLGIAGGMEIAADPWRVAAYTSARHKKLWALGVVEYGGTGLWYKTVVSYDVGPISFGVLVQRFDGVGPRASGTYKGFELWAAPLYDFESSTPNVLVGLNWSR